MYDTPEARDLAPEDRWDEWNENETRLLDGGPTSSRSRTSRAYDVP